MTNLALRIKEDRFRKGLSQSDYGDVYGVSRPTVALWESDGPGLTAPGVRIAKALSVDEKEFQTIILEMAGLKAETPAQAEA